MATFMELLDTSISNVSLPHIAGGLGTSYDESTWVLTSYLVANAVILPMSAWLSRVFGRKRYYMMCVTLFTATSFLCGIAPSLGMLVFFRVLQGIGGGGLAPVEQAILVDTFPRQSSGAAFALYSMAIVTAPADRAAIGRMDNRQLLVALGILHQRTDRIDLAGAIEPAGTRPVEFTEERKQRTDRRQTSNRLYGNRSDRDRLRLPRSGAGSRRTRRLAGKPFHSDFLVVAIVAIALAIWWEWRHDDPVVELTLLRERNFAIANVYYFCSHSGFSAAR